MNLHNDPTNAKAYTRRAFIQNSAMLASAALTVPAFIQSSAFAMPKAELGLSSIAGVNEDNILVIIQLSGGNDGLNTVVPYRDDAYYRLRPSIGIRPDGLHILSKNGSNGAVDLGLNQAMTGIRELYDEGQCAIIQGVGYPNPNRSHFTSMDIWHTGETTGTGDGWLGRYIDAQCCGYGKGESGTPDGSMNDKVEPPIAIGNEAPLMLTGRKHDARVVRVRGALRVGGQEVQRGHRRRAPQAHGHGERADRAREGLQQRVPLADRDGRTDLVGTRSDGP